MNKVLPFAEFWADCRELATILDNAETGTRPKSLVASFELTILQDPSLTQDFASWKLNLSSIAC